VFHVIAALALSAERPNGSLKDGNTRFPGATGNAWLGRPDLAGFWLHMADYQLISTSVRLLKME